MEIYRVTRKDNKHGRETTVKTCTKRSLSCQITALKDAQEWAERSGRPGPGTDFIKIERAQVGEFEDVTGEFL